MKFIDLTNNKIGKLTVMGLAQKTKNRSILWKCKCDCGNEIIVRNVNLLEGLIQDCGCEKKKKIENGDRFTRLVVINQLDNKHFAQFVCKCDCGNVIIAKACDLRNGVVKSCGCLAKEIREKGCPKHNLYYTRLNKIYDAMKRRCFNHNHIYYNNYGGRGITICDEWLGRNGFVNFYSWATNNGYKDNLSIDRIDNNKNYSPENCKWSTTMEQQHNKRNNVKYHYNNEYLTAPELARKYNISLSTLNHRIKKGMEIKQAIETPINTSKQRYNKG